MALLGNKNLTELDTLKTKIDKHHNLNSENKKFLKKCDPKIYNFGGEENFIALIIILINNKKICDMDISKVLEDIQSIYFTFELSNYGFSNFLKLFFPNGIYENKVFSLEIVGTFEYIENYFIAMQMIIDNQIALQNFEKTKCLITSLRMYATNDDDFISMLAHFLTNSNFGENYQDLVDYEINLVKMRAGVYENLSDKFLAKMDVLLNKGMSLFDVIKKEEQHLKDMHDELRLLRTDVEKEESTFAETIKRADKQMEQCADECIKMLERKYIDFLAELRNDQEELSHKLVDIADTEAKKAALDAVNNIEKIVTDLSNIKSEYKIDLSTVNQIKETATEEVNKGLKEIKDLISRLGVDENVDLSKIQELLKMDNPSSIIAPSQTIVTPVPPGIIVPETPIEIKVPDVLPCFDESIAFKERLKMIMDRKAKLQSEGEVFNVAIDECIYYKLRNFNIYLYGPSGAGKDYFAKQLAKLFELPLINIGYINDEYDIVGGKTANGAYSPSNFYKCWRNGYIAFAPEFDNSIAQATIKLNEFLDCEVGENYSFPSIGFVKRHPNFRFIAAGNTMGMGATTAHNARQKIDESIQQRFKYVKFDFDENVEQAILEDYKGWYEFSKLFREALYSRWQFQESDVVGQITTRDLRDIAMELEDGVLSVEKILQLEFIETKDVDCLSYIRDYIKEHYKGNNNDNTKTLIDTFSTMVNANPQLKLTDKARPQLTEKGK